MPYSNIYGEAWGVEVNVLSLEEREAIANARSIENAARDAWCASHTTRFSFDGHIVVAVAGSPDLEVEIEGRMERIPLHRDYIPASICERENGRIEALVKFPLRFLPEAYLPAPLTPDLVECFASYIEAWFVWDEAEQAFVPDLASPTRNWGKRWVKVLAQLREQSTILVDGERYQFPISQIKGKGIIRGAFVYEGVAEVNGQQFPVRYEQREGACWQLIEK